MRTFLDLMGPVTVTAIGVGILLIGLADRYFWWM